MSNKQIAEFLVPLKEEIIEKWNELYEDKNLQLVHIENVNGKSTQTKFRNIKSSKYAGKGVIRIPNKIQIDLETSKGELVTINNCSIIVLRSIYIVILLILSKALKLYRYQLFEYVFWRN